MASMSKRAQARTERELHELLTAPGNSVCADCGARNPSWASWNLGIFLCMRCASIHRKLGTHISKVKSLSMDTWSPDQVENMKKLGNSAVNKEYNPKNRRPDMPLDADEVDSAMERFIRKKYQEKSLSDGRPEVPTRDNLTRDDLPSARPRSSEASPPPVLPAKKGKFFGFKLRASSSAYPLSKHDRKHRNESRMDSAFRVSSENNASSNRATNARTEISDYDLQMKLAKLRDMGFKDDERNANILKRHNGDVERSIATLVKLGPGEQSTPRRNSPPPAISTTLTNTSSSHTQTSISAPQTGISLNPFQQANSSPGFPPVQVHTAPSSATFPTNPWQSAISTQPTTGLEQSLSNLQVSQPLFPHNTGPYSSQPQYAPQPVSQVVSPSQQQSGLTGSPMSMNNPFIQAPLSAHSTGSNPYASHMQAIANFAPSTNPFLGMQANATSLQSNPTPSFNPFGLPPSTTPPHGQTFPPTAQSQLDMFDSQLMDGGTASQPQPLVATQHANQQQIQQVFAPQSPIGLPNFQYGQPQLQQFQQSQRPPQSPQAQSNPFWQQQQQFPQVQQQQQPLMPQSYTNPYFQQPQQQQQHQQPLLAQQTGLMDKRSIMALYNHPQLAPNKPLASIPEPSDEHNYTFSPQQATSPISAGTVYGGASNFNLGKRSATMPVSTMHSASGVASRNPFMTSANSSASSTPLMQPQQYASYPQGARHASQESMAVNNQGLQEGRHSPDAFANLSARYMG